MKHLIYALLIKDDTLIVQPFETDHDLAQGLPRDRYPRAADKLLEGKGSGLTRPDRRILMSLAMRQGRTGAATISGRNVADLLPTLCETERAFILPSGEGPLTLRTDTIPGKPRWHDRSDGITPALDVSKASLLFPGAPAYALLPGATLSKVDCGLTTTATHDWREGTPFDTAAAALAWFENFSTNHPEAEAPAPPEIELVQEQLTPTMVATCRYAGRPGHSPLQLAIGACYGTLTIGVTDPRPHLRIFQDGRIIETPRDRPAEAAAATQLKQLGLVEGQAPGDDLFSQAQTDSLWTYPAERGGTAALLGDILPALTAQGWTVQPPDGQELLVVDDSQWYSNLTDAGRGYFSLAVGIRVGERRINILPFICDYLAQRRAHSLEQITDELGTGLVSLTHAATTVVVSGQRLVGVVAELFELFGSKALDAEGQIRLNQWRVGELEMVAELDEAAWQPPAKLRALASTIRRAVAVDPLTQIDGLQAQLRDYQAQGIGWLAFIGQHDLGGVLADDMGLGKTVQLLGYLAHLKAAGGLDHPVLVVAPTSVLRNWQDEAARFTPHLTVHILHGAERHDTMRGDLSGIDILVTSYALLRRDAAFYAQQPFSVAVLDEAQFIKNPRSKVAQAAYGINAQRRFALTGTPVENHLTDLWSLFHFVLPGFLGGLDAFRETFQKPIEKEGADALLALLSQRVRPLLLRRRKSDVLLELPPCSTIIQRIDLTDTQQDRYETLRLAMTAQVREEMAAKGFDQIALTILSALLKLRQICCDPRLGKSGDRTCSDADSAKLAWLATMLPEMVEEGRRVLLFSQFTSMLDLIKTLLDELRIPYVELTGATRDRAAPIKAFQDGQVPIFLVSLKAGGTGLNLTTADTVIHYDPWWNPAVEQQATDRAHRIGQQNHLFVYKLITRDTIEERILNLQSEKQARADGLLAGSAGDGKLQLDQTDLTALLAPITRSGDSAQ